MVLVIDVGNTNIVFGLYDEEKKLINYWRKTTDSQNTADELGIFIKGMLMFENVKTTEITDVVICSVVPNVMYSLNHMVQKYFNLSAFVINSDCKLSFNICYDNPSELGADRIANIEGALLEYNAPMIIIDMGTATTLCCIDSKKNYLGGVITPGVNISMDALYKNAAQLKRVEIEKTKTCIAKNTIDGMKSGVYFGYIGLIEKLIDKLKKEMGENPIVIATGGMSSTFEGEWEGVDIIDKFITLNGIYNIFLLNKNDK